MKRWLSLGATGVLLVVAGVLLVSSGTSADIGLGLAVLGAVMLFVSVVALPLAARWALFRTKGRAVLFGAGVLGRIIKVLVILVAAAAAYLYMAGG